VSILCSRGIGLLREATHYSGVLQSLASARLRHRHVGTNYRKRKNHTPPARAHSHLVGYHAPLAPRYQIETWAVLLRESGRWNLHEQICKEILGLICQSRWRTQIWMRIRANWCEFETNDILLIWGDFRPYYVVWKKNPFNLWLHILRIKLLQLYLKNLPNELPLSNLDSKINILLSYDLVSRDEGNEAAVNQSWSLPLVLAKGTMMAYLTSKSVGRVSNPSPHSLDIGFPNIRSRHCWSGGCMARRSQVRSVFWYLSGFRNVLSLPYTAQTRAP
jgi:hypothetical protein